MQPISKAEIQVAITQMERLLADLKSQLGTESKEADAQHGDNRTYRVFRVVSDCGKKAITFAYRRNDKNRGVPSFEFGVSDSGSAAQFDKKLGVKLALERLNGPNALRLDFAPMCIPHPTDRKLFISGLECTVGLDYEVLSRAVRPQISASRAPRFPTCKWRPGGPLGTARDVSSKGVK